MPLYFFLCCAGGSLYGHAAETASQVATPEAAPGVLVLTNGNFLQGVIAREADVYRVQMPHSELTVRVNQVDMLCHSVDEVYERRRSQRVGASADSYVDLARWCLRHNLLEYASRELLEARAIDSGHRQLAILDRQLQLAFRNLEAKERAVPVAAVAAPEPDHSKLIKDVPDWARTLFVRQIQPLLVESCAASGCHQPGAQEAFHLNRLALDGPGHPTTTLNNLAATLAQLDLKSPDNSVLLLRAKQEHGGADTLKPHALTPHQYHMLRTWVEQLSLASRNRADQAVELAAHHTTTPMLQAPELLDPFDPDEFNRRASAASDDASASPAVHPESE